MSVFSTMHVDRSRSQSVEPLGSKPKFWFRDGERRLLFKAEDRGTGEDWAEVVACHLCALVGLPHVEYELAAEYDAVYAGTLAGKSAPLVGIGTRMNSLFVSWRPPQPNQSGWRPIGRLEHDGDLYRFWYTQGARKPEFRPFAQLDKLDQIYESEELFPLFANRLLSESRPEYEAYLRWSGFEGENPPDPIAILGVTEGIRQTDAIEVFPCPAPDADGCYFNKFLLHGVRWMPQAAIERIAALIEGEPLKLGAARE